ncbi:hypothetical protein GQ457_09G023340 [Hibiscus cannabinus]
MEDDYEIPPLTTNPTVAQIKAQKEKKTRTMSLKSAKEMWDYLKTEYARDEKIHGMQVLNLEHDFELQKMRETEIIKEYSDRLVSIANKVRLLEQRRVMRQEWAIESALPVRHQDDGENKRSKNRKFHAASGENSAFGNKIKAWNRRPRCNKCNQMGREAVICYVGQLVENGFKVKLMEKTCVIENATGQKMFEVEMKGRSFSLNPMQEEQSTFLAKESIIMLWHKRLGHYHHQGIVKMNSESMVIDLLEFDDHITTCKACQFGKQNKKSFPNTAWRATCKLQLIHTDISGPQRTSSLLGNRYYAAFIDDFTRMRWIFFLKFKSDIAGAFWKFKRMVENQSANHIQILSSDNGKEYTSDNFNAFCEEADIEHQLIAPYSPQQNGVSERRNK